MISLFRRKRRAPDPPSGQGKALFRVAKEYWFLVPPWWNTGELVATVKDGRIGLLLRSSDFPDRPQPSHALVDAVKGFLAEGITDRRPLQIVLRISGSNPPVPEILAISDAREQQALGWVPTCDVVADPAKRWETEFLTLHASQHFHRVAAPSSQQPYRTATPSSSAGFLHRVGLPERGLFSYRIVFPESGLVSIEESWPVLASRYPRVKDFGVLGTSKVNLLCRDNVRGSVVRLDLDRGDSFRVNKSVAAFAHAVTVYKRSSTSSVEMEDWLLDHDRKSLEEGGFWDELIGELRQDEEEDDDDDE